MKKQKHVVSLLVLSLVFTLVITVSASATEITPFYSYTDDIAAALQISGGKATCGGKIYAISTSNKCSITAVLKRLEGDNWVTVSGASWSGSGTGSALASGTKTVSSGYSYRVFVTGKILNSSGTVLETVTTQSKIVNYS